MSLKGLDRVAYKVFGKRAKQAARKDKYIQLELQLEKAQMTTRAEAHIAKAWFVGLVLGVVGLVVGALLGLLVIPLLIETMNETSEDPLEIPAVMMALMQIGLMAGLPLGLGLGSMYGIMGSPRSRAKSRAKNIDHNLAYASNYMAAMASADVIPAVIFKGLANQDIYGEIKGEAGMIARDLDLFGQDLLKVLERGMDRSPSVKFQDFLQGIITTASSGGSLKAYFMAKAEQYTKENRVEQHSTLETLGVMAESFVTVVVAMPLFLIVMMSVMAMMGGESGVDFLYIIVGLMIPMFQVLFIVILSGIKVE